MKVVIVGGVAGGASAAARIRRLDETAEIILIERTGYISYANCGLPYYIGNEITDESDLTLQTPQSFHNRFKVDVRIQQEAISINPAKNILTILNLQNNETYEETYDKLILSPGAKPNSLNISGTNNSSVFTLRTVEDTLKIKKFIEEKKPKTATVIGGGFIGLEMAENLTNLGINVTIVEFANHVMPNLDPDMAAIVHAHMQNNNIKLLLNTAVTAISSDKNNLLVETSNNVTISTNMVLLATGVIPDTKLAKDAGLALGVKESILVNNSMQTSNPNIYAVGDAIQVQQFVTGQPNLIPLAGPANKQGRIAANNICGKHSTFNGTQGSSIIKLFNTTVATTGVNEQTAKTLAIPYESIILSPASHATYYPGSHVLTIKALYNTDTLKLLGAQIIGSDGVDKRIDVLATALRAGIDATDLAELELAYAPPYSSAKDPVNMVGFMVQNIVDGFVQQFHYDDIATLPTDGSVTLLDTRTPAEYAKGYVTGFVNIPVDNLRERIDELPKNIPVYVMCQSGLRSYLACRILMQNGYTCYNFSGGYRFYKMVKDGIKPATSVLSCGADSE